jgi:hypothetical protein
LNSNYWQLRGNLDVPKERWVSFPHCEGEDASPVIAWAGYDHLQLARAIAERYEQPKALEMTVAEVMACKPPVKSLGGRRRRERKGA